MATVPSFGTVPSSTPAQPLTNETSGKSYAQTSQNAVGVTPVARASLDKGMMVSPIIQPNANDEQWEPLTAPVPTQNQQQQNRVIGPINRPRRRSPNLCFCGLQRGVLSMAWLDMLVSFTLALLYAFRVQGRDGKLHLFSLLTLVAANLFVFLSLALVFAAIRRSKILSWIFIVGNFVLLLVCIIPYFILFWEDTAVEDSKWVVPFLLFMVMIYKIYESICVFFFMYEDPPNVFGYGEMFVNGGVVPVVYSPGGVYYVAGQPAYYYNRGQGGEYVVAGTGLGPATGVALSHGLYY